MFALQRLLIDRYFLGSGIDLNTEFTDDNAVHGNAAATNEFIAAAPRTDAGVCQYFVETFHTAIVAKPA